MAAFATALPAVQAQSSQLVNTAAVCVQTAQIGSARARVQSSISFHSSVPASRVQFVSRRWASNEGVVRMSTPVAEAETVEGESSKPKKQQRERNVTCPIGTLQQGQEVTGKVVAVQPYGAFVDIGSDVDGLLHISQISAGFIKNVEEILKVGDEVTAFVKDVDIENKKVALTKMTAEEVAAREEAKKAPRTKRAPRDLTGKTKLAELVVGAEMTGKVASISEFGAFVDIGAVKDGLLHISEVSTERIAKIEDALQIGQDVTVRVVAVDLEKSKISLTMLTEEQRQNRPKGERRPRGERGERSQPVNPMMRVRMPGQEAAARANAENAPRERRARRRDDDDDDMPKNTGPRGNYIEPTSEETLTPLQLAMLKAQKKA
eukprot:tig00021464_g21714.t1